MSDSNRVKLSLIEESAWGKTPATPTFITTRHTGESLSYDIATTKSTEIRSDRNTSDLVTTDYTVSGGFDFEWSFSTFDEILESALFGAWATNVLKNGTTEKSFSIERGHLDIAEYFLYTGMVVDTFSMDISAGSIITGAFGFTGEVATLTQATAATTLTAASVTNIMSAMTNVANIKENNVALTGVFVNKLSFNVANSMRPIKALGSTGAVDLGVGSFDCGGTLELYFANDTIYDKFIAGTASTLEFQTKSGDDIYTFKFPKVKFSSDKVNSGGLNSDVMEVVGWEALYDATALCSMQITRTA